MAKQKQPYIPFYLGDYIKDTRRLPLAVRGAWIDLILFMWDEPERGEITATIDEFARMLSCSVQECQFAVDLLIEKKVCNHEKLPGGKIKIISRRMKKELEISLKRSESGKKGNFASNLNRQNNSFATKNNPAKTQQNTDNDNEYDNESNNGFTLGKSENPFDGKSTLGQMLELWVKTFPSYTKDPEYDLPALRKICDFIFHQAQIKNGYGNTEHEIKALNTFQLIADQVNRETFWCNKPLTSISKNIQEFYNKIKNPVNGSAAKPKSGNGKVDENILKQKLAARAPIR